MTALLIITAICGIAWLLCFAVGLCQAAARPAPEPPADHQERACAAQLRPRTGQLDNLAHAHRRDQT